MTAKEVWKKFWNLFWNDNSWKGWVVSLLVLFIAIKFIFFPVLSFATGTQLPLAIVESCSMYHEGNLLSNPDKWFEDHEGKYFKYSINTDEFEDFSFKKGFNKGDILFVTKADPEKLKVGDVIIFNGGQSNPIIHRIIKITEQNNKKIFSTIGDNNNDQLNFEKEILENQLVGKAGFRLGPYIGWAKLIFFEFQKPSNQRGFCDAN